MDPAWNGLKRGPIHRSDRVVYRSLEQGAGGVLLHLDSAEYRQLNEMGALIWSLLETNPTREDLLAELRVRIRGAPPELELEVDRFVLALHERGLITIADG